MLSNEQGPLKQDPSELEYSDYDKLGAILLDDSRWDHRLREFELVPGVFGWYNTRTDAPSSGEYGSAGLMVKHPEDADVIETEVIQRPVEGGHVDGLPEEIGRIALKGYNRLKTLRDAEIEG